MPLMLKRNSTTWPIWLLFFLANLLTIFLPWAILHLFHEQLSSAAALTPVLLLAGLRMLGILVALANIVWVTLFVWKQKPQVAGIILSIIIALVSLGYVVFGPFGIVDYVTAHDRLKNAEQEAAQNLVQTESKDLPKDISAEEAKNLLSQCQVSQYHVGAFKEKGLENPESSSTGIILVYNNSVPWRISVATRLSGTFDPIYFSAIKTCKNLTTQ